jgi:hypothetical protein
MGLVIDIVESGNTPGKLKLKSLLGWKDGRMDDWSGASHFSRAWKSHEGLAS